MTADTANAKRFAPHRSRTPGGQVVFPQAAVCPHSEQNPVL
ncbi:hypothetical protein QQM79_07925 [Marinobacteraceae bacterium S3BR75-40.1]